jgi:uncharacterized lipoprotein NlpE involved in copper resistance
MRTRIAILAIIAAAVSLSACFSNVTAPAASQPPDMHTSQTSLDWDGSYAGVVPCADCAGIETFITINEDLFRTISEQGIWARTIGYLNIEDLSSGKRVGSSFT